MTQTDNTTSLRRHVLETGFIIIIGEKELKLECTIKSASRTGATLQVATTFGIPLYCDLVIDEKRRHCRAQRKRATNIGVLFQ
ncbi:MAG: PilZ domain-containing protein [Pseudolabrys sp.]